MFERFARGRTLKTPTLVSSTFAEQMLELFELEGLIVDGQVSMHAIKNKLEDGTFSPELFN